MNFDLDIGLKAAAQVQAQYAELNRLPPARVGDVPEIEPSFLIWWVAWQDLKTDRPPGGLYSIPHSAIALYADRYNLDLELLKRIIWGLDEIFLERERIRIKRETGNR